MQFFSSAIDTLQTLVVALGTAGLGAVAAVPVVGAPAAQTAGDGAGRTGRGHAVCAGSRHGVAGRTHGTDDCGGLPGPAQPSGGRALAVSGPGLAGDHPGGSTGPAQCWLLAQFCRRRVAGLEPAAGACPAGTWPAQCPVGGQHRPAAVDRAAVRAGLAGRAAGQPAGHPVVVVGGGFIGIEVAENLHDLGIDVTLVEAADQLMAPFDRDMASFIHAEIRKNSIHLMLDTMVEGFADTDCGIDVKLKNAPTLHTDMVVMAIGVAPETSLAKDAGIELGIKGSIVVNDKMETSIPDIYAVGDAVQIKNFVLL